jgi:hypothetical protein
MWGGLSTRGGGLLARGMLEGQAWMEGQSVVVLACVFAGAHALDCTGIEASGTRASEG